jgi:predicted nucleic acid-binding protein
MTTAAEAPEAVFIDTNVLIYAAVPDYPEHAAAVTQLSRLDQSGARAWISRQVLREYLAALTRPSAFTPPIEMTAALADLPALLGRFAILEDGSAVTRALIAILQSVPCGGKQVHDANIVATMLAHGVRRLLTHNVRDFQRFTSLIEVLPLVEGGDPAV